MSDTILLKGVKAFGYHGVYEFEKREGQDYIVDLLMTVDLTAGAESDDINKTTDYSVIAKMVEEDIKGPPLDLIEALALKICRRVLKAYPSMSRLRVTVHKPQAPIGVTFEDVYVSIERTQETI
jgi:dihydroneopterin aldolase